MNAKKPALLLGGLALCAALLPASLAAQPTPLTPEIEVNNPRQSAEYLPAVATEPDGDFLVATVDRTDPSELFIRVHRFTAAGMAVAAPLRVSQTGLTLAFTGPSAAIHASGNFLVAWEGLQAVLGRVFDASGTPRTGEIEIHRYPGTGNFRSVPYVRGGDPGRLRRGLERPRERREGDLPAPVRLHGGAPGA
jgi:hypothetical protein